MSFLLLFFCLCLLRLLLVCQRYVLTLRNSRVFIVPTCLGEINRCPTEKPNPKPGHELPLRDRLRTSIGQDTSCAAGRGIGTGIWLTAFYPHRKRPASTQLRPAGPEPVTCGLEICCSKMVALVMKRAYTTRKPAYKRDMKTAGNQPQNLPADSAGIITPRSVRGYLLSKHVSLYRLWT